MRHWRSQRRRISWRSMSHFPFTRLSAIEFSVADVKKPLASAAKMVKNGNRVILDHEGSFIMKKATGERAELMIKDEAFAFDVQRENGEQGTITLDPGRGCTSGRLTN